MGILSASCSFTRFKITEPVPKELWMEIPAKLRQFAFQDIDDIAEERGWGWTSFEDMLDMQWRSAPPEKGAYLAFALRLDTRRIPPAVLKKYVTIASVVSLSSDQSAFSIENTAIATSSADWSLLSIPWLQHPPMTHPSPRIHPVLPICPAIVIP